MNLPNKLTILRVILIPFYIYAFYSEMYILSLVIFVLASLTDTFDGILARRNNDITNFGKIMDPLADKMLVYTAFILFTPNFVKAWMLILIIAREFLVSGIRNVAASNGNVIAAGFSGKAKTMVQMITVPLRLLYLIIPNVSFLDIFSQILLYLSLILTVYSGVEYIIQNKGVFKD